LEEARRQLLMDELVEKVEDQGLDSNRDRLTDIFRAALLCADPYRAVADQAAGILTEYHRGNYEHLYVIGFGKGLLPMVRAITDRLGHLVSGGVAITKYGHDNGAGTARAGLRVYEAGHPLPDENGLRATAELIGLAQAFDDRTLVVCLISGGGSALLVQPYGAITLEEKQKVTDLLLKAGADIHEMNVVRKHISSVKGGRLAEMIYPARIKSLILSDVIGDRPDVIASGPTSPDGSTYSEALAVLEKYGLADKVPGAVLDVLHGGGCGLIPETPKEGNPLFGKVENIIVGSNRQAVEAARVQAQMLGFDTTVLSTELQGEARQAAGWLAERAIATKKLASREKGIRKPVCLISGGETTVTVTGAGTGGRNMELALAFALDVQGEEGIYLLSAGTDGSDGPTDAAGAIVDGHTTAGSRALGMDPERYLADNDSYNFFKKTDGLFITGPTGTNVMDVQIILVGKLRSENLGKGEKDA
jgi:glycerate 2-kinase